MAFHLITTDGKEFSWHVQSGKPKFPYIPKNEKIISALQADGDELELIIKTFHNLPLRFHICTWRGDMAQFIYDNL